MRMEKGPRLLLHKHFSSHLPKESLGDGSKHAGSHVLVERRSLETPRGSTKKEEENDYKGAVLVYWRYDATCVEPYQSTPH